MELSAKFLAILAVCLIAAAAFSSAILAGQHESSTQRTPPMILDDLAVDVSSTYEGHTGSETQPEFIYVN